jgi:hypothetical protein
MSSMRFGLRKYGRMVKTARSKYQFPPSYYVGLVLNLLSARCLTF